MKKNTTKFLSLLVLGLMTHSVFADGYIGASMGSSNIDGDGFEDDNGYKLTAGVELDKNFSLEASYINLGEFEANDALLGTLSSFYRINVTDFSVEISGLEFSMVGVAPVGEKFSLYGRVGMFMWDTDVTIEASGLGRDSSSEDGSDWTHGFGVMYALDDDYTLKAGYGSYEDEVSDIEYVSIGVNKGF